MNYPTYFTEQIERLGGAHGHYNFKPEKVFHIWQVVKGMDQAHFIAQVGSMMDWETCPTVEAFKRMVDRWKHDKAQAQKPQKLEPKPPPLPPAEIQKQKPAWPEGSKERALARDPELAKTLERLRGNGGQRNET